MEKQENSGKERMVKINGEALERYKSALPDLESVQGLEEIEIDNRGFSWDIAVKSKVGRNYLNEKLIIVSEEQQNASCKRAEYSFIPELMDSFYAKWGSNLAVFTRKKPLLGDFALGIKKDEKENKNSIEVALNFDTESKDVEVVRSLVGKIETLSENPRLIMKKEYMAELFEKAKMLNTEYGSIKGLTTDLFFLKLPVESFSNSQKYYLIGEKEKLVEIDLLNREERGNAISPEIIGETISDKNLGYKKEVLSRLVTLGAITPAKEKIKDKMKKIQEDIMKETQENDIFSYYHSINQQEIREKLPKEWYTLREALNSEFFSMPEELMLEFITEKTDSKIVSEILQRLRERE